MRFLLNPTKSAPAVVIKHARTSITLESARNALQPAASNNATETGNSAITSKAWGQQCSPNCGCILRFEANLSDPPSKLSTSPIVVSASFHTKRVIGTRAAFSERHSFATPEGSSALYEAQFKPLLTSENTSNNVASRPILTPCTCPTLHHLAQRVVNNIPGKSIDQLRNEIDAAAGVGGGGRTSIPFRYTVLKETVPNLQDSGRKFTRSGNWKGSRIDKRSVIDHMNEVEMAHGHCYDLVEESFLSMINERMPRPRKDGIAECFSPTMGGYFGMYSFSRRNGVSAQRVRGFDDATDDVEGQRCAVGQSSRRIREVGDWRRMSPSSYFLFGDDTHRGGSRSSDSPMMIGGYLEFFKMAILQIGGSIYEKLGMETNFNSRHGASEQSSDRQMNDVSSLPKAPLTYLQLLDMYGDYSDGQKHDDAQGTRRGEDEAWDDWLGYVDRTQFNDRTSTSG